LSEDVGKVAERIWEGSRKRRTAHGTGCSESGSIVFLVEIEQRACLKKQGAGREVNS